MKNCAWRLGSRYGMAYIEDNGLASKLLKMEGIDSKPSRAATATYYTPSGKAFAWQVKFSMDHWDRVARTLGIPVDEKAPRPRPKAASKPAGKAPGKAKRANVTKSSGRKPGKQSQAGPSGKGK